jgi:3-oxoacyl-[acyl-carrier protein] reductase
MGALTGRTALVTGGSRGIGRGIALRLAVDGARVAVHYGSNEEAAKETVAAIEAAGGEAFAVQAELGVPGDAKALWEAFDVHAEGVDVIVNNAGAGGAFGHLADGAIDPDDFDKLFALNTKAPFFITQEGLPRLRDNGRVINISTGLTRTGAMPELIAYAMSKGAIDAFTINLAKDLGPRGITVNTIAPGVVDTDMNARWLRGNDDAHKSVAALSPLNRVAEPADIADIAAFLASDDSRWVTGQWIDATGGALL